MAAMLPTKNEENHGVDHDILGEFLETLQTFSGLKQKMHVTTQVLFG
jgi:hypothetical protein